MMNLSPLINASNWSRQWLISPKGWWDIISTPRFVAHNKEVQAFTEHTISFPIVDYEVYLNDSPPDKDGVQYNVKTYNSQAIMVYQGGEVAEDAEKS